MIDELSRAHTPTRAQQRAKSACSTKKARDEPMRPWLAEIDDTPVNSPSSLRRQATSFEAVPGPISPYRLSANQASPRGSLSPTPTHHIKSPVLSDEFQSCAQPNGGRELAELLGLNQTTVRSGHVLSLESAKTWRERTASYDQKVGRPKSSRQHARPRLHLEPCDTARNVVRVINTSSVINTERAQLLELLQTAVLSGHVVLVGAEEKWEAPQKYLSSVTAALAQQKTEFVALFRGWFSSLVEVTIASLLERFK